MKKPIQFCKKCLYSSEHPLGLTFNEKGICSGCLIHDEKDVLDWNERWRKLEKLVEPYRSRTSYDCIIPVSGGHDSYFIVDLVKNRLGMNPLLVTYNRYFNTPLGIRNLANLRINFDSDILIQNVNPVSVKNITRTTLRIMGSMYWPILAGQTVFPVQTAVNYQIPLIIWGAHQGLEQVGMFSHENEIEMTRRYRKDHDLMGYEADDLLTIFDELGESDIFQYRYPDDQMLQRVGVRGIYLGNYVRWDQRVQNHRSINKLGYLSASSDRTFDTYEHVECFNYMNLHDFIKLLKHGYSRVTDHATREIRHGRLNRQQGLFWVKKMQCVKPRFLNYFCDWLGVDENALTFILNQHRNPIFWEETRPSRWNYNDPHRNVIDFKTSLKPEFVANSCFEIDGLKGYVTIGKGWTPANVGKG
ncbi:N-acetyl sugar amidotransferase [Candidatus Puniceispirillum sp.]|nr:N-acetyl sugar amidotransferase [Candidatus Puniceispirillum sp.]